MVGTMSNASFQNSSNSRNPGPNPGAGIRNASINNLLPTIPSNEALPVHHDTRKEPFLPKNSNMNNSIDLNKSIGSTATIRGERRNSIRETIRKNQDPAFPVLPIARESLTLPTASEMDLEEDLEVPDYAMWVLMAISFLDSFSGTIIYPVIPYFVKGLGGGASEVGYAFAIYSVSSSVLVPLFARLADFVGRRPTLLLSLFLSGSGCVLAGIAPNLNFFYFAQVVNGSGFAIGVVSNSYVSDVCISEKARTLWYSRLSAIPGFTLVAGPPIGGMLAGIDTRFPMFANAAISYLALAVAFMWLQETPAFSKLKSGAINPGERIPRECSMISNANLATGVPDQDGEYSPSRDTRRLSDVSTSGSDTLSPIALFRAHKREPIPRKAKVLLFSSFFIGVSLGGMAFMNTLYLEQALHFAPDQSGITLMGLAFVYIFMSLVVSVPAQAWLGKYNAVVLGSAISLAAQLAITVMSGAWGPIACIYLQSAGSILRMSTIPAILSYLSVTSNRMSIFSFYQMIQSAGRVLAQITVGHLANIDIALWPFLFLAVTNVATIVLVLHAKFSDEPEGSRPGGEDDAKNDVDDLTTRSQYRTSFYMED